jgi:hypothetical protein
MTPNRPTAIAFQWSISAVIVFWMCSPNALAQGAADTINGVYSGTYTCAAGPRTLELSLLASGRGSLTGVFTFYLPPTSHTRAFSYSMSGTFDAASGQFKLIPDRWETPPPAGYSMVGMAGAFDPGTGRVAGKITYGNCGAFQATRDQAKPAHLTRVVPPNGASAAGSSAAVVDNPTTRTARPTLPSAEFPISPAAPAIKTTAAAPPPAAEGIVRTSTASWDKPACQLIPKASLESILGFQYSDPKIVPVDENSVPFGSLGIIASSCCRYVSAPEGKSGVVLTLWHTKDLDPALAKDYFYHYLEKKLTGRHDVTSPGFPYPAVFSNVDGGTYFFKGGPNGLTILMVESYVPLDVTNGEEVHVDRAKKIALEILRLPQPTQALPASARTTTPAPSPATAGIISKPKAYWETYYRSELIMQVFDGNFSGDLNSSTQFRMLFGTYVDMFSEKCHAYLPARHETITLAQATTKTDRHGNVVSREEGQPWTVDVDSRFAPKYRQYAESLLATSPETLAGALAIASGRVSQSAYFAPGTDVITFFKIETCQSPAMHQFGENLLRAAEK